MNYEKLLESLIAENTKYMILTSENRGGFRSLPPKIPGRFFDFGIAEQTMVGVAAGFALRGKTPIIHALAAFLTMRPFEFIRTDIGIANLPVKIVGSIPGFLSEANGPTHQALEDVSLMMGIPNMNVFCPADEDDMIKCLPQILDDKSPVYIRYNPLNSGIQHEKFVPGKAEMFGKGKDVALLVYGPLFKQAFETKTILEAAGVKTRLINMRTLKPIDSKMILNAAKQCSLLVTIEDHFITGGLYSIISGIFLKHGITKNVLSFSLNDRWFKPGLYHDVLNFEGFTAEKIAAGIMRKLKNIQGPRK